MIMLRLFNGSALRTLKDVPARCTQRQFSTTQPLKDMRPHYPYDGYKHANVDLWYKITWYVSIPAVVIVSIITFYKEYQHFKHYERPEFVPLEYLRIRSRPFPWGDGNHSLFHNQLKNALPTGYEPLPEWYKKTHPGAPEQKLADEFKIEKSKVNGRLSAVLQYIRSIYDFVAVNRKILLKC